jgi:DNA primase
MVSYKEVKAKITIEQVLQKYGVRFKRKGKQLVTDTCPFCGGGGFKASPEKNCFKCFSDGCTAKGNILDFVALFEKVSIKQAAQKLYAEFLAKPQAPAAKPILSLVFRFKALFS